MAPQLRIQYEGTLYHIISRGNERRMIFLDEAGRIKYLNILHKTIERFNWKYNCVGHVLQGRYKSSIVQKEAYLLHCCRYIVTSY